MFRKVFSLLFILSNVFVYAQKAKLKTPIGEKENAEIRKVIADCFSFEGNLKVSYSTTELYNSKVNPDKPASLKSIEELKKQLTGRDEDVDVYIAISGNYARLNQPAEAETYRDRAVAILKRKIQEQPDSVYSYYMMGAVYMGATQVDESLFWYRKAWDLNPKFSEAPAMMSNLYGMYGQLDSAYAIIARQIKNYPDQKAFYTMVPLYYLYQLFGSLQKVTEWKPFTRMEMDSILAMPFMDDYYARHKDDFEAEYVNRVAKYVLLSSFITLQQVSDTTFDSHNIHFNLTPVQNEMLLEMKAFFESCLKRKETMYHYYGNKVLGNVYTLTNEPKKAIPYLRKTIDLKPKSNCSLTSNSDEDYDNLIIAYFILHDTAAYEKVMLEKIKVQPTVDPKTSDYINLAGIYVSKGKYEAAKVQYQKVLEMDAKNTSALLGLGLVAYVAGNDAEAMKIIDQVYKIDNKKWELYALYAALLLKQNDAVNAYSILNTLYQMNDRDWVKEDLLDKYFEKN